jgi:hypothetical protein
MLTLEVPSSAHRESLTLGKANGGIEIANELAIALGKRLSELAKEAE